MDAYEIRSYSTTNYQSQQTNAYLAGIGIAENCITLSLSSKSERELVWMQQIKSENKNFLMASYEDFKSIPELNAFLQQSHAGRIVVMHDNRCMLVPDELVNISESNAYYGLYKEILPESQVLYCRMHYGQITALFNVPNEILKFIRFDIQADDVVHAGLLFIKACATQQFSDTNGKLFVQFNQGYIEIAAFENQFLQFYNQYNYENATEALYFIQLVAEKQNMQNDLFIVVYGNIQVATPMYELLNQYSKRVILGERYTEFRYPDAFIDEGPHTFLTESACLLCE